jgi:hypothetical protein
MASAGVSLQRQRRKRKAASKRLKSSSISKTRSWQQSISMVMSMAAGENGGAASGINGCCAQRRHGSVINSERNRENIDQ